MLQRKVLAERAPFSCPTQRVQSSRRFCRRPQALGRDDLPEDPDWTKAQEVITILTSDGSIVRIPGSTVRVPRERRRGRPALAPLPSWEEQSLCIGASFCIGATNGHDVTRRVKYLGFCQSLDLLAEAVEEVVTSRGGEVLEAQRQLKSGVHEQLKLSVWIPFLFGVPPEEEALSAAIVSGGGILDRVLREWGMYGLPQRPARGLGGGGSGGGGGGVASRAPFRY